MSALSFPPPSLSLFHPFSPCIYLFLYINPKILWYRYLVSSNTEMAAAPGFMERARAEIAPNFLVVAQQPLVKVNNIVSSVFLSLSPSFNLIQGNKSNIVKVNYIVSSLFLSLSPSISIFFIIYQYHSILRFVYRKR